MLNFRSIDNPQENLANSLTTNNDYEWSREMIVSPQ